MFKLGLRLHLLTAGPEEELLKARRQILRIDAAKIIAAISGPCPESCPEFCSSSVTREVTATFTTAGVTRDATASTALSSAISDETLFSSSGPRSGRVRSAVIEQKRCGEQNRCQNSRRNCELLHSCY